MVLVFDIGGTTTKVAVINNERAIINRSVITYPHNDFINAETLSSLIKNHTKKVIKNYSIVAICFSTCGIIAEDGSISGLSAITNYHQINWKKDLQEFQLPVYVENDANCSLLAEHKYGIAKGYSNAIAVVLGTGIGGAIIINNQILKGLSGEFGCFLEKIENNEYINLSTTTSPRNLELRLNSLLQQEKSLQDYLLLSYETDQVVKNVIDEMIFNLAKNIVNLSFTINPEIFVIGGAISDNDWFIKKINHKVDELMKKTNYVRNWQIVPAKFKNDANILGAYSLYEEYEKDGK